MRLNSKIAWGLAWAGLALVVAVPSADFLTRQFGPPGGPAVLAAGEKPATPVAATPVAAARDAVTTVKTDKGIKIVPAPTAPAASTDPVEKYLSTGKPLPDYISDRDTVAAAPPAPAKTAKPAAPVITAPVAVASVPPPAIVPPRMPLPLSARPKPLPVKPAAAAPQPEPAVIVDEATVTSGIPRNGDPRDPDGWDTESLRDYLERRGILDGADAPAPPRSRATVTQRDATGSDYDPDGFYLSDGPNADRTDRQTRRDRILRMLDASDDGDFTLF